MKNPIKFSACAGVVLALLLVGCADDSKNKWKRNGAGGGSGPQVFKTETCLTRVKSQSGAKVTPEGRVISGNAVYACAANLEEVSAEAAAAPSAYGPEYRSFEIKPKFKMVDKSGVNVMRVKVRLMPNDISAADKKLVEDTIINTCLPKINEVWKREQPKFAMDIRFATKSIDSTTGEEDKDYDQTLVIDTKTVGETTELVFAIWPFHSSLKRETDPKKNPSEQFCRSVAKLSAMWIGIPDPAAPSQAGAPCEQKPGAKDVQVDDSLMVGYTRSVKAVATEATTEDTATQNFWTRARIKEDREMKAVLAGSCAFSRSGSTRTTTYTNHGNKGQKNKSAKNTSSNGSNQRLTEDLPDMDASGGPSEIPATSDDTAE